MTPNYIWPYMLSDNLSTGLVVGLLLTVSSLENGTKHMLLLEVDYCLLGN